MINKIILLVSLTLFFTQLSNAQTFDQQKYDERREQAKKNKDRLGKKFLKTFKSIQEELQQENYDKTLAIIDNMDKEKLNTRELTSLYQLQAASYQGMDDLKGAASAYEQILELPSTSVTLHKQMSLILGQIYYVEDDPVKALEYFDLHFTYEKKPRFTNYQAAFAASLSAKDYDRAISYVDITESLFKETLEKQTDEQREKNKEGIEKHQLALTNMRVLAQRGLDGEDITAAEEKTNSDKETEENS